MTGLDWLGLVGECVLGVCAPFIRGGDDHAGGEEGLPGGGEKGINVAFRQRVVGEVELALDGAKLAGRALLRDEVYADVADVPFLRELVPHPDAGEALGIDGVELQVAANKTLEAVAEFAVGGNVFAELGEDGVDGLLHGGAGCRGAGEDGSAG